MKKKKKIEHQKNTESKSLQQRLRELKQGAEKDTKIRRKSLGTTDCLPRDFTLRLK